MRSLRQQTQAWRPIVTHRNHRFRSSQVEAFLHSFAQTPGLPFADVIDAGLVEQTLTRFGAVGRDSIYPPALTLSLFVGQAIDPDPSLRRRSPGSLSNDAATACRHAQPKPAPTAWHVSDSPKPRSPPWLAPSAATCSSMRHRAGAGVAATSRSSMARP